MKSFKQFINEQLSFDDLDDLDDFGDDFGDDLNLFPDSLSNLKKLSKKDILFYKNLITSDLEYDNVLAEAGLNNEGIAVEDFIELALPEVNIFIEFLKRTRRWNFGKSQTLEVSNAVNSLNILKNLKELELSRNYYDGGQLRTRTMFRELPTGFRYLQKLTYLSLSGNPLKEFPLEILKNKSLKRLMLRNIQLDELPKEIGQLKELELLDLSHNNLVELPKEIGQLQNLVTLQLDNNNLVELPKEIGQLKNLIKLDLYDNNLTSLPHDALKNLSKLNAFDVNKNLVPKEQLDLLRDELPQYCIIYPSR
jgi:Leucine-rich repeat (LRR) protein